MRHPNCEHGWVRVGAFNVAVAVWCSWVCTAAFFRRIHVRSVDGNETANAPAVFSASPSAPEEGVERGDERYPAQIGDAIASQEAPRIQARVVRRVFESVRVLTPATVINPRCPTKAKPS